MSYNHRVVSDLFGVNFECWYWITIAPIVLGTDKCFTCTNNIL